MSPAGSGLLETAFTRQVGVEVPIICGAMYPCTNPELVAAVSAAGGIGIIQPISLTYVYRHDFREGVRRIRGLTSRPIGMNVLIEKSSKSYHEKMTRWLDIALEEGVRFIITSLGKPDWVVKRVHAAGGLVYHDVTERKWAEKGIDSGVDGLIAVNNRAGGHAGTLSAQELYTMLAGHKLPLICAGGIGSEQDFVAALRMGYAGVQQGTRFIATRECGASEAYKRAIVAAREQDIVLSERITGVPVSVIATATVQRLGLRAGFLARWLLRGRKTKHLMRTLYTLRSLWQLKRASLDSTGDNDYWQAGKSVAGIHDIELAGEIIRRYAAAARQA
jgi:nitronate monooxygenase